MQRVHGLAALGATLLLTVGITGASDHSNGMFTTSVSEDHLFENGGRVLQADLTFSQAGTVILFAPKGTELEQTVPPVVWQYSGLLPISDYLKTVAIHTVASQNRDRSWQQVQRTFHDSLIVEGASEMDAKIAYAGAYAFAPRWPLVDLVEAQVDPRPFPDTVLYEVQVTEPGKRGTNLESYRLLALQIFQSPDTVSLDEIMAVIDNNDAIDARARELGTLGGISNVPVTTLANDPIVTGSPVTDESSNGIATASSVNVTGEVEMETKDSAIQPMASSAVPVIVADVGTLVDSALDTFVVDVEGAIFSTSADAAVHGADAEPTTAMVSEDIPLAADQFVAVLTKDADKVKAGTGHLLTSAVVAADSDAVDSSDMQVAELTDTPILITPLEGAGVVVDEEVIAKSMSEEERLLSLKQRANRQAMPWDAQQDGSVVLLDFDPIGVLQ